MKAPKRKANGYHWDPPDEEWLYEQYVTLGQSAYGIALDVGTRDCMVRRWLRRAGIPLRTLAQASALRDQAGSNNPAWRGGYADGGGSTRRYGRRRLRESGVPKQCAWCKRTEELHVHHRDHNYRNNKVENLQFLCRWCHFFETALWHLLKQGRVRMITKGSRMTLEFDVEAIFGAGPAE